MSEPGPFDDEDLPEGFDFEQLFGGGDPNAMLANLMSMFGGGLPTASGGLDQAMQLAISIASGGKGEPNVDPMDRMALEQLARVAELQIGEVTGLRTASSGSISIAPVNRTEWVKRSMQSYKPILEQLAASMSTPNLGDESEFGADPQMAVFEQLFSSMRPMMVNMTTGSMLGHLGTRAIGTYDLPLPRVGNDELLVVVPNLDDFGDEWSLDRDELRMWIALSEVAHHAVLSIPHIAARLSRLIERYAGAFRNDPSALGEALSGFEPSGDFMEMQQQLQSMFGDPSAILGAMRTPEQDALLPELSTLVAAIVGYIDHVMDEVGGSLISSYPMLTEALRRRRVTASESDRFVEKLLGLELDQDLYDRGRAFIDGVVERAGTDGRARLWEDERNLPTPNELAAPGLWLERIEIDFDDA
ncbi:MAG: zinc-dependent metalloprotease [Acidimicrobiales bacterium]